MRPSRAATCCLLLSLIGIGLAGYLVYLRLGLLRGELLGGPACSAGAFNCHAVTASGWGQVLGMPLALWGIIGYLAVFSLAVLAASSPEFAPRALALIALLAAAFVAIDLALLALMVFVIQLYCLFCLLTYAVNLALLVCAWRAGAAPAPAQLGAALGSLIPSGRQPTATLFWGMMLIGVSGTAAVHAGTLFVSRGPAGAMRKQIRDFVQRQPRVSPSIAGEPMLGRSEAPLTLVEYSDFFCPSCQRAFKMNAVILAGHRQGVRFVFKHYPLDQACNDKLPRTVHPGACQAAAASECAHAQGKFWPVHDRIFEEAATHPQHRYDLANLDRDMAKLGVDLPRFRACMESGQGVEAVKRDIAEGAGFGVTSTPTFYLNGLPIVGQLLPATFDEFAAVMREQP